MNIKFFVSLIVAFFAINNMTSGAEIDKLNTFYFTDGACIAKHFTYLEFASGSNYVTGEEFDVDTKEIGGKAPLKVSINQTLGEFIIALWRTGLYTTEDSDKKRLTANWTRVYSIEIDGFLIEHTPMYIQFGRDKMQNLELAKSINGFSLTNPLILNYLQTEEEFTKALIHSGIYDPANEASKCSASPWTRRFETVYGVVIERTPTYIKFGDHTGTSFNVTRVNVVDLPTPLVLNLLQTEEEFTAALRKCRSILTQEEIFQTSQSINEAFASFGFI